MGVIHRRQIAPHRRTCTTSEREDMALDAAMDQLMRTTPPLDAEVPARLLLEARDDLMRRG